MLTRKYYYYFLLYAFFLVSCGRKSETTKPVRKDITETVFASGTLEPDQQYNLTAQAEGHLTELNLEEGNTIPAGKVVAVIDNIQNTISAIGSNELLSVAEYNTNKNAPAFKQIEASISAAAEKLKLDIVQEERYKVLYEKGAATRNEYETRQLATSSSKANLDALRASYDALKKQTQQQLITQRTQTKVNNYLNSNNQLKVVVSGKVYKKFKEKGDYVRKGDIIATIGNPNVLYAKLSVDESNIAKVQVGQEVAIQLNTYKSKYYKGNLYEILPSFDESTQSFYCKAKFTDSLDFKLARTQLQANIIIGHKKNALLIPRNYLGYGNTVMVKGKKEPVKVTTGFIADEWVEITGGIQETTLITTENLP
jgi:multidrug efflux pump subunit AcrA (membrane-fusion protein)